MTTLIIKLVFGCLMCKYPIPMHEAREGKMFCSKKCLREFNEKYNGHYDMEDVITKEER